MFTGCQTTNYQEEFSLSDLKESGIRKTTNEMNSLCNLGTCLMDLHLARRKKKN
jgi:hypothetical protein